MNLFAALSRLFIYQLFKRFRLRRQEIRVSGPLLNIKRLYKIFDERPAPVFSYNYL